MKKIIALTTVEQAKKYHRYMWRWLARHPQVKKDGWPGFRVIEHPKCMCFACWVGILKHADQYKCLSCPISVWARQGGLHSSCCSGENNTFAKWFDAVNNSDYDAASKFAMTIAEYEWEEL